MTEEEKREIVKTFQEKFNILNLSAEIQSRLTTPAVPNKIYEAEVTKKETKKTKSGKPFVLVEMMTSKREVLTMISSDLFCDVYQRVKVGKKYTVFYSGDKFKEITILKETE
jgi:hypothetical protein